MNSTVKTITAGVLLAAVIVNGFILSNAGKPYSTGLFTIHKLTAAAAVVFIIIISIALLKTGDNRALYLILAAFFVLSFAGLAASGAVMSIKDSAAAIFLTLHRIAPVIFILSAGILLYMYQYNSR